MSEQIWERAPKFTVPQSEGTLPISCELEKYETRQNGELLSVRRCFANLEEFTEFHYKGPFVEECVGVENGKITEVNSNVAVHETFEGKLSDEEIFRRAQRILSPPKTPRPQYTNILRFAEDMKLLIAYQPSWKQDIEAICNGSGFE